MDRNLLAGCCWGLLVGMLLLGLMGAHEERLQFLQLIEACQKQTAPG